MIKLNKRNQRIKKEAEKKLRLAAQVLCPLGDYDLSIKSGVEMS